MASRVSTEKLVAILMVLPSLYVTCKFSFPATHIPFLFCIFNVLAIRYNREFLSQSIWCSVCFLNLHGYVCYNSGIILACHLAGYTQAVPWPVQGHLAATTLVSMQVQQVPLRDKLHPVLLSLFCSSSEEGSSSLPLSLFLSPLPSPFFY